MASPCTSWRSTRCEGHRPRASRSLDGARACLYPPVTWVTGDLLRSPGCNPIATDMRTGAPAGDLARLTTIALTGAAVVVGLGVVGLGVAAWTAGGVLLAGLGLVLWARTRRSA